MLIVATEGEKKQKERLKGVKKTPKKGKRLPLDVVGSSSTWKEEHLDRYKVSVGILGGKEMIPEKWFDFTDLRYYEERIVCTDRTLLTDSTR